MESIWSRHGAHREHARSPHRAHMESTQSTHGVHTEHTRSPHGVHMESTQHTQSTHGFHTWSTHGVHTEHTRSPYGAHAKRTRCTQGADTEPTQSTPGRPGLQGGAGPGIYSCPASGFLPPASSETCRIQRLVRSLSHHLGNKRTDAERPPFSSGFLTMGAMARLGSRPLRTHHTVTSLMISFSVWSRISISFYALLRSPPTSFFPLTPFLKTSLIPTIFKAFMECVKRYRSRFMFWFFGHEACGILAPQTELEPTPQHWKAESQPLDHRGSPELIVY